MLDFRPHKIKAITFISGGKNEDGMPLPDTEEEIELDCRIVPNGSASQVHYDDGEARNYSFTVYLNQDCREFKKGERVRLFGLDGLVPNDKDFEVVGFHRNQLNAQLWVS